MHQRKSKKVLIYFLLLIIVSSIGNYSINNLKFRKIQKINISGLDEKNNQILLNKIKNLNLNNIFFLNEYEIIKILNSNNLIESYKVFKRYPSELDVDIKKTTFLAKINIEGKEYLIGSNRKFSKNNYSNKNLPYIFGNPKISEFLDFKNILDQSPIAYEEIKSFYFFQSKRWDLEMKNGLLIKLPAVYTQDILSDVSAFLTQNNLNQLETIDARVKNQIIVNE